MSYQTSSKRSPPFWLQIGARKTQVFWHIFINEPFWSRLKVTILFYFARVNEVRQANYHT